MLPGLNGLGIVRQVWRREDMMPIFDSDCAGLGLSICKAIVDRANETIRSGKGAGAEVIVTLPAVKAG